MLANVTINQTLKDFLLQPDPEDVNTATDFDAWVHYTIMQMDGNEFNMA
jgi:hypothetical protein